MRKQRRSSLARLLTYILVPALALALLALVVLVIVASTILVRVQRDVAHVGIIQANTCRSTNEARRESNENLRLPLKQAVTLASGGTVEQRAATAKALLKEKEKLRVLESTEKDPAVKALLTLFIAALTGNPKITAAYAVLAAQIAIVPELNCITGKPIKPVTVP